MKPVIFIPGFPASELVEASSGRVLFPPAVKELLNAGRKQKLIDRLTGVTGEPEDIVAGQPILSILHIAKQAQSLYDILRTYGYTMSADDRFAGFGWDWRNAIDDPSMQQRLIATIEALSTASGSPVVCIVHSTGGLVLRQLLESHPEIASSIEQVLAFGVPWAGALKSLFYVVKGESIGVLNARLSAREVANILGHAQAAYDLLPPDPVRTDMRDRFGDPFIPYEDANGDPGSPLVDRSWIPPSVANDFMRERVISSERRLAARSSEFLAAAEQIPVTCVAGWGAITESQASVDDGKVLFSSSDEGDGTVLAASASWLRGSNVRAFFIPIGIFPTNGIPSLHSRIWDAPPLLELFDQVLLDKSPDVFFAAAADGDAGTSSSAPSVEIRMSAADATGEVPPDCSATFVDLAQSSPVVFGDRPTASAKLKRSGLHANFGNRYFRFVVKFAWTSTTGEETREVPVVIRM